MDTTKWKSVLMPRDIYEEVVVIARVEGRTISGQLRYITEAWKQDNLTKNDQAFIKDEVAKYYNEKEGGKALTSKSFSI